MQLGVPSLMFISCPKACPYAKEQFSSALDL